MRSETMSARGQSVHHSRVSTSGRARSRLRTGSRYLWLALITGTGLLFRLWLWWRVPFHQPANDEFEYLRVASDLIAGRGWVFYEHYHWLRAPLYPIFLAGSLLISGQDLRWAALPNIALSTMTIPLFYLLGRSLVLPANPTPEDISRATRTGIVASVICALLLPFATFASLWMSETLFTALFAGALILLLRWRRQPHLKIAAAAGLLLGLAILTRSAPLAALPLLLLWMLWGSWRDMWRRRLLGITLCLLVTGLTIVPWTIRNWIAYGHFIPVETGLSYNLWAFNEPREDMDTIFRMLESIPNPGERADYATAKGIARLREDPSIILRRVEFNWFYLWHVNPIEDRFLQESYSQDVPGDLFVLALLLDDGLYLLIMASALAGMLLMPRRAARLLFAGWLVYIITVTLLTHSEGRYRQFLFPALIPLAAVGWGSGWWPTVSQRRRVAAVGFGLLVLLPLNSYPYEWAGTNLGRAWFESVGDRAMRRGDYFSAQRAYQRGAGIDPNSADILLKAGLAFDRAGDLASAIKAYGEAAALKPTYIPTSARLGDALRRAGQEEGARAAFLGFYSDPLQISDWAWEHLQSPADQLLEIGDGLDAGFVQGMYKGETVDHRNVRWTSEQAALRLAAHGNGSLVRLRLAAPRPDGRPVIVQVCLDGGACQTLEAGAQWRTVELLAPPLCRAQPHCASDGPPATLKVTIAAPAFSPARTLVAKSQASSTTSDTRRLGVLLDYALSIPIGDEELDMLSEEASNQGAQRLR